MRTAPALAAGVLALLTGLLDPAAVAAQQPSLSRVTWLVFVDDLHLSFRDTGRIRQALKATLDGLVQRDDRVLIRSSGPSELRVAVDRVTDATDRERLAGAVKRVTGNALTPEDIAVGGREPRYRARMTVEALHRMIDDVQPIEPPAALLYLSDGYTTGTMDLSAVVAEASRAGAALYPIDQRRLPRDAAPDPFVLTTRETLRELASAAAGTWQDDDETLDAYLSRIAAAVRR